MTSFNRIKSKINNSRDLEGINKIIYKTKIKIKEANPLIAKIIIMKGFLLHLLVEGLLLNMMDRLMMMEMAKNLISKDLFNIYLIILQKFLFL